MVACLLNVLVLALVLGAVWYVVQWGVKKAWADFPDAALSMLGVAFGVVVFVHLLGCLGFLGEPWPVTPWWRR
jgi:hypothetical protein